MKFTILKKVFGSGAAAPKPKFAFLALLRDIEMFPPTDSLGVVLLGDVIMKENCGMMQIYITPSSQEYGYETSGDSGSKGYKVKFNGTHPGTEEEALGFVTNYLEEEFVLFIPDCKKGVKVLGSPEAPLIFTSSHKSGKEGQKFNFVFEQEVAANFIYRLYDGIITINDNIDIDMGDFLEALKNYIKIDGSNLSEMQKQNLRQILGLDTNEGNIGNKDLSLNENRNFNLKSFFLNFFNSTGTAKVGINKNNPQTALDVVGGITTDDIKIKKNGKTLSLAVVDEGLNNETYNKEQIQEMVETDFKGTVSPTDPAPTVAGSYKPKSAGTYTNLGGLVAKEGYDTLFYYNGTTWSKSEVAMPQVAINGIVEEGNMHAVSGGEVFTYVDYDNLYNKMELPKPFAETTLTNVLTDNNFNTIWWGTNFVSEGVSNNIYKWRASAQNGRITGIYPSVKGNVFFISIWVKANANIRLHFPGISGDTRHSGSGDWEKLSMRVVGVVDGNSYIYLTDPRISGWDSVEVKKVVVINLTSIYGQGSEPTLLEVNNLLSSLPDNWFGTTYSFQDKLATNGATFVNVDGEMKMVKVSDLVNNSSERLFQNVFGKSVPNNFKEKLFNGDDVEIVCVGDSLTGLIGTSTAFTEEQCQHLPPGMTNNHWTYQLWDKLNLNKPINNRVDAAFFTKVGVFSKITGGKFNLPEKNGEYSTSDLTFESSDLNASASFVLNTSLYKKCNIVYSANQDGCLSEIIINEGNGLIEVSTDKTNWVEANNFEVNQNTIPSGALYNIDNAYQYGAATHQRHRRIWLRVKDGVTSDVNITYKRKSTDVNTSYYFYMWGIEMWNQQGIFVTNLGRGGRNTLLLNNNITDISSRNPDLLIYEMPLANETNKQSMSVSKTNYLNYFINGGTLMPSLKTVSSDFTKFGVMVVMPHGKSDYFEGNKSVIFGEGNSDNMINNIKCKSIFNYTNGLVENFENVITINLMEQLYNEAYSKEMTIQDFLKGSADNSTITTDGIHLNDYGSFLWTKYLKPLFQ